MRTAFLGTPAAAIPSLAALADITDVDVVVTMPDAAAGRSRRRTAPPVKVAAAEFGFEVVQPSSAGELAGVLRERDLDVGVVVAYGRLLSPAVLEATRVGFVNVHFSLLPRWRGAAPVERTILAGDDLTGASLMLLDQGLDTGPVISVAETDIGSDETAGELTARLSYLGAELLFGTLTDFLSGRRDPAPQIEAAATLAPMLTTAEARLDPGDDVETTLRKVRAYNPRPGAWLMAEGKRLKVWRASPAAAAADEGSIVVSAGTALLGVSDGGVTLDVVQPEGKGQMAGISWLRGRHAGRVDVDAAVG
jgi:methionyl-tRNA formyltransferase